MSARFIEMTLLLVAAWTLALFPNRPVLAQGRHGCEVIQQRVPRTPPCCRAVDKRS